MYKMELIKIEFPEMENMELPHDDVIQDHIHNLLSKLDRQVNHCIIEGLKRKGFIFDNENEMEKFIITRCRCEDFVNSKQKVYYVDNIPFFLHNYTIAPLQLPSIRDGKYQLTANLGSYAYL